MAHKRRPARSRLSDAVTPVNLIFSDNLTAVKRSTPPPAAGAATPRSAGSARPSTLPGLAPPRPGRSRCLAALNNSFNSASNNYGSLHPNDLGYEAMANAINLALFRP